jgi:hypothetical protein
VEIIEESRERQRLYVPSRSSMRRSGAAQTFEPKGQPPDYEEGRDRSALIRGGLVALIALANVGLAAGLASRSAALQGLVFAVDLFGAAVVMDLLLRFWHAYSRGILRVRWTSFPVAVGGRLEGVLVCRPALEPLGPVRAVLRCVRDEQDEHGGGEGSLEPVAIYRQVAEVPVPDDKMRELPFSFDLPPDLPGTDLSVDEATYWQLALRIPVIGPDIETVFLAPVYPRQP